MRSAKFTLIGTSSWLCRFTSIVSNSRLWTSFTHSYNIMIGMSVKQMPDVYSNKISLDNLFSFPCDIKPYYLFVTFAVPSCSICEVHHHTYELYRSYSLTVACLMPCRISCTDPLYSHQENYSSLLFWSDCRFFVSKAVIGSSYAVFRISLLPAMLLNSSPSIIFAARLGALCALYLPF